MEYLDIRTKLNNLGKKREDFFFLIDYSLKNYDIIPLDQLPSNIKFQFENQGYKPHTLDLDRKFITLDQYRSKFNQLQDHIGKGNCYLANLTQVTKLTNKLDLLDIYNKANGRYKLYYKDQFVSFSPEQFCQIKNNKIYTYPMKGTIDASIPNAKEKIIKNQKELAEHTMVVDLLRNDLSMVATQVKVEKFRYIQKIDAGKKQLYQISSTISGKLENNWEDNIGDIITTMLPAGSITGTPKKSTVDILSSIEGYKRGYFTGIFGVYKDHQLNSAVAIRYIEKQKDGDLIYKSGGGITSDSDLLSEYQELQDKVYIP